uniref:DTW domain-containing protein 2 isoform X4 n=1 Tax=Podarcis muralis TaxID=64176 RepID=UPI0010A0330B|nr:DTW domain-containing protein 2 isoform X4 [Podarcis muralis]
MEGRETPATDAAGGREDEEPLLRPPAPASGSEEEAEDCGGLWELPVELSARRPECGRCGRPEKVCLCPFLPVHPLKVSTCLYIIQHPAEESRVLRTVPLLAACLPEEKCKVLIGRRFSEDRYPELASVCRNKNTLILYPGAGAANLEEVDLSSPDPYVIIIIDGTWSQAKDIFFKNTLFRIPKQEHIHVLYRSVLPCDVLVETQLREATKGPRMHHRSPCSSCHIWRRGRYKEALH